jgi:PPOX class probable F420-dependent enzyme
VADIEPGSDVANALQSAQLGWLTTVHDGQPQSSYVWFHFDGSDVLVLSRPDAGKVRNVRAHPRVSFHLDGDGRGGGVLTIDARAVVIEGDLDPVRLDAYLAKYDAPIRNQLNTTPEDLRAQFSTAVFVTPARVRSW